MKRRNLYLGERGPLFYLYRYATDRGFQTVRFFGVTIGCYFIGVQRWEKTAVRQR